MHISESLAGDESPRAQLVSNVLVELYHYCRCSHRSQRNTCTMLYQAITFGLADLAVQTRLAEVNLESKTLIL